MLRGFVFTMEMVCLSLGGTNEVSADEIQMSSLAKWRGLVVTVSYAGGRAQAGVEEGRAAEPTAHNQHILHSWRLPDEPAHRLTCHGLPESIRDWHWLKGRVTYYDRSLFRVIPYDSRLNRVISGDLAPPRTATEVPAALRWQNVSSGVSLTWRIKKNPRPEYQCAEGGLPPLDLNLTVAMSLLPFELT